MDIKTYLHIRSKIFHFGWRAFPYKMDTYVDGTVTFYNRDYKQIAIIFIDGNKICGNSFDMFSTHPWQEYINVTVPIIKTEFLYNDGNPPREDYKTRVKLAKLVNEYDIINEIVLLTYPENPDLYATRGRRKFSNKFPGKKEIEMSNK